MRALEKLIALKAKYGVKFYDPTIYEKGSVEYERLEKFAKYVNEHSTLKAWVQETYFDGGQGWKWTTVIVDDGKYDYQLLNPAEQAIVVKNDEGLIEVADYILEEEKKYV